MSAPIESFPRGKRRAVKRAPQFAPSKAERIDHGLDLIVATGGYDDEDAETLITDVLADLRHYCAREGINFKACLRMSETHYECEKDGSEEPK
jgi:hypothetical protein